jgi:flagellar biosynthesis component FlhA
MKLTTHSAFFDNLLEGLLAVNGATTTDHCKYMVLLPNTANFCSVATQRKMGELTSDDYLNALRTQLRPLISFNYSGLSRELYVYLLDPKTQTRIERACHQPLSDQEREQVVGAVFDTVVSPVEGRIPVILTTPLGRRPLRKVVEAEFPWLSVLSYSELMPDVKIRPIATICL